MRPPMSWNPTATFGTSEPRPLARPAIASWRMHVVLHEREDVVHALVLVVMGIDVDDQHVVELALLRLLAGMGEQAGGVELLDGTRRPRSAMRSMAVSPCWSGRRWRVGCAANIRLLRSASVHLDPHPDGYEQRRPTAMATAKVRSHERVAAIVQRRPRSAPQDAGGRAGC